MSDLDASRAPRPLATPISGLAHAKLRSLGNAGGISLTGSEGVLDAFAEVFAQMAAASPVRPAEAAPVEEDISQESAETRPADAPSSDRDARQDSQREADQPRVVLTREEASPVVEQDDQAPLTHVRGDQPFLVDVDRNTTEETGIAIEELGSETNSEEVVPLGPVNLGGELHGERDRRRHTRDQAQPLEGVPGERRSGVHRAKSEETQPVDQPVLDEPAETLEPEVIIEPSDRRRSRRDRNDRIGKSETPTVSQKPASAEARGVAESTLPGFTDPAAGQVPTAETQQTSNPVRRDPQTQAVAPAASVHSSRTSASPANASSGHRGDGLAAGLEGPRATGKDAPKSVEKSNRSQASEAVSRAKLVQRVSKAFQHLGPEGGMVRLRLAPAELGTVRVEMRIQRNRVNARVVADNEATGSMLREHLPDLRNKLESFGMQIERIEVSIEQHDSTTGRQLGHEQAFGQSHSSGSEQQDRQQRDSRQQNREPVSRPVSSADTPPAVELVGESHGGVDLRF